MRLELLFLGKTRQDYLARGIDDFSQRLRRYLALEIKVIKPPRPPGGTGRLGEGAERELVREEGRLLLSRLSADSWLVALDGSGESPTSPELAGLLEGWQQQGRSRLSFVLGGHLGLDREVLARANYVLSLSRLTFTHEMARLLLLEQLYRAWTIRLGGNYHK
ncbi:MAG: 23S rRNA (pseudouridine(1915)-N(3))-methyltransferase RlmH [Desulfurivibrio sp.]|nr:23S rRNA (pseudouridine(1915)-N(3))-methyltransferase RlmH [Desulfurivibrio sp.]